MKLSSGTKDAKIYYTLDGSDPTTKSYVYTGTPISIAKTTTLKAMAVASGYEDSEVKTYRYSFLLPKAKASIPSGKVQKAFSLKLSSGTKGATIYYTLNGKTPTTSSKKYSKPITIKKTTTVKAIVVKGKAKSKVAKFTYRFK